MMQLEEFLNQIATVKTRRELWAMVIDHLHDKGVVMASFHATNMDGQVGAIVTDGFPEDWTCKYIEEDLVQIDPIPELAASMSRPFYWHEIKDLVALRKDAKAYLDAMDKARLGDGLAFYVYGPGWQNAYVGLGFGKKRVDLSSEQIFELQCIVQATHLRYCALCKERDNTPPPLTARERDVLNWIAKGKSNGVIADILAVSPHTIDTHVRKIFDKLNVTDRTTAALRGLGNGLIKFV